MAKEQKKESVRQSVVITFYKDTSRLPEVIFSGIWSARDVQTAYKQMARQLRKDKLEMYKEARRAVEEEAKVSQENERR